MPKIITDIAKKLTIDAFNKQALAIHVGATLEKLNHGHVEIKFPKHPLAEQHHGYFHGGVISYLGDISAGLSAFTCLNKPNSSVLTIEFKINFIKAAQGPYLLGKGSLIKQTGTLCVCMGQIFSQHNDLIAVILQTNRKLLPREHKQHKQQQ